MGLFNWGKKKEKAISSSRYEMMVDVGNGFYSFNGNVYQSDIVRAAMRPKSQAIGKAIAKHVRRDANNKITVNPDAYMRFLLEEPNPIMTQQMMQEKMANQLELNGNAFALIVRDGRGYPMEVYPLICSQVVMLKDSAGTLYCKFYMKNGTNFTFKYTDIIHLRKDFNENEYFGEGIIDSLLPLMEVVSTTDQGIIKAIKNSNIVRWLLKFNQTLRPDDIEQNTKDFVKRYLSSDSETIGAAATDAKADAIQVEPKDFVPNEGQMTQTTERIYSLLNTNKKIVQSSYTEDEWISYYEAQIEPTLMQLSGQYSIKCFSRRERGFGNRIVFESSAMTFASMQTKLRLVNLVDRAILSRNEVREYFNLAPVDGGDEMILRLDTARLGDKGKGDDEDDEKD